MSTQRQACKSANSRMVAIHDRSPGVTDGSRTRYLQKLNLLLYLLSYCNRQSVLETSRDTIGKSSAVATCAGLMNAD